MNKIIAVLAIVMVSCGGLNKETIKDFIPGTYVRFAAGQYSKAWDTLHIHGYDPSKATYIIEQRVGFHRITEGKLQPKEHLLRRHTGVLDEQTQQLEDRKTGKYYTFSPERGTMLAGSAEYIKTK